MKQSIILALIQGLIIFIIVGLISLAFRQDFFYRHLAPLFGGLAAVLRFVTANIADMMGKIARNKD